VGLDFELLKTQELDGLSGNQIKIFQRRGGYQRDDPTIACTLGRVAHGVALSELLYLDQFQPKIFDGVSCHREKIGGGWLNLLYNGPKGKDKGNFFNYLQNMEDLSRKNSSASEVVGDIEKKYYDLLSNFKFLPNSPTLMNVGRELGQLSGCYVLSVSDSINDWASNVGYAMMIHKSGGGTGFSFSNIRPSGDRVGSTLGVASGPLSPLRIINVSTEEIKQGGTRRGANMGVLSVYHPDILDFIDLKLDVGKYPNFNLSVAVDEKWMKKVFVGGNYNLINPRSGERVKKLNAKEVFDRITQNAYFCGDPGIVFIDRHNWPRNNPTPALGQIESTNPCGEQSLLAFESCNLGSINLYKHLVKKGDSFVFDTNELEKTVRTSVRFLDNVIDINKFPLPEIEMITKRNRKIGLGVMGFAETIALLGWAYNSKEALGFAERTMRLINETAMSESESLAEVRGKFPNWDNSVFDPRSEYFAGEEHYPRNAGRTTIAPTGTIAIAAGLDASGIEPPFKIVTRRKTADGVDTEKLGSVASKEHTFYQIFQPFLYFAKKGNYWGKDEKTLLQIISDNEGSIQNLDFIPEPIKRIFMTSHDFNYKEHIDMQAAFQRHTDHAVSKTVNFPETATVEDVRNAFTYAHKKKTKGVTIYVDNSLDVQVLDSGPSMKFITPLYPRGRNQQSRTIELKATSPDGHKRPTIFINLSFLSQGLRKRQLEEILKNGERT